MKKTYGFVPQNCLQLCLPQRSEFVFLGTWVQIVEKVLENCQQSSELAFVFIE